MAETRIDRRRVLVRRACALIIGTAFFAAVGGQGVRADEAYIANPKPPTDGRVGANYTPAYTVNQVQFWHDFRAAAVEEELAAAQEFFGISTLRVYLHNINFDEEKNVLLANLEKFLTICEAHGIKPGFVFFDDCHREDGIFLDKPTAPVKGFHNGRWAQCPQKRQRDPENLEKFIRRYATGKSRALFFDDFQEARPMPGSPGWKAYSGARQVGSERLALEPDMKMVAGDAKWTDYVFEGRVMLKSGEKGDAGLIFRVNDAGNGYDQMRGYYVGLDTKKIYLGKVENNWQPLAEFDLSNLDCKVLPDVWNLVRVAVEGPRIRVWGNRMHPSSDPDRGLRIDFTDEKEPILSGAIGVRAHLVPAGFDNIVVLPVDVLSKQNRGAADTKAGNGSRKFPDEAKAEGGATK